MSSVTGPTRSLRSNTNLPAEEPSAQKLFNNIRNEILNTNHSTDLTFQNISPSAGFQIATSFSEDPEIERALPRISYNPLTKVLTARVMPTTVQDCHQEWLSNELLDMVMAGFLTVAEREELRLRVGTSMMHLFSFYFTFLSFLKFDLIDILLLALAGFAAPYTSAVKEPDACILPDSLPLPTVAVESCWSESWPRLEADRDLWLVGGTAVELVLLIRWTKISNGRVKGDLHVHGRDLAGNVVLLRTEVCDCYI
ncbi:hypothetical protein TRV_03822 [Trichophyton verrucosum HKI 0517]|uniref:Uncharacterized protein n=1 Tax=Trichophyton verrucosum (strain HKI 0517) TaxID=663202 RepID=D4D9M9_TRIVH|nr:uncharacterized protein TRV_03822 [Trichophyton verrucosum HKI 0517]EFE41463.1 hypothetical protein TRV_03822 [Trichophyton verrucosum HKI 0517]